MIKIEKVKHEKKKKKKNSKNVLCLVSKKFMSLGTHT